MYNIKFQFNSVYEAIKWIFCLIDPDLNGKRVRMFVNKETTELINGIIKASQILKPGGKILVVSFRD